MTPETAPVLIAVDSPTLHPEAIHVAAATGRPVIDARDAATVQRHASNAHAILIDAPRAPELPRNQRRGGRYFIAEDPGAIDFELAMKVHADEVFVLPAQVGELLGAIGQRSIDSTSTAGAGTVLAVTAAAGGAGCSTFVAALALSAAENSEPVLIDANRYSGGLDLLLGIEEKIGARWGEITFGEGDIHRGDIRQALPSTTSGVAVLTSARTKVNMPLALGREDLDRAVSALSSSGLTLVDTPPGLIPARCDLVVVMVPLEVRAAAAAARIVAECRAASLDVLCVARHRDWSGMTVSELERITGADVCAEIPTIARLTKTIEVSGLGVKLPRGLHRAAQAVYARAGVVPLSRGGTA
ncbi:septum site-determining protein Ssd [Corynebacterium sp. S7]